MTLWKSLRKEELSYALWLVGGFLFLLPLFFISYDFFFMLCFIIWVIILMFDALYISSANRGDSLDRKIDQENLATKDFLILVSKNNSFAYARCLLIWISFTDVAVRRITRKLKKSYQRKWSFSTALLFRTGMQSFMSKLMTTLTLILVNTSSSWKLCLLPPNKGIKQCICVTNVFRSNRGVDWATWKPPWSRWCVHWVHEVWRRGYSRVRIYSTFFG